MKWQSAIITDIEMLHADDVIDLYTKKGIPISTGKASDYLLEMVRHPEYIEYKWIKKSEITPNTAPDFPNAEGPIRI